MVAGKRCSRCRATLPHSEFYRCNSRSHIDGLQNNCKACHRQLISARMAITKQAVIAAYGGKCECPFCDVTDPAFLTIDHINNDGTPSRAVEGRGSSLWAYVKRRGCPRDRYRVLCFNCNCGRRHGDCPHVIAHRKQLAAQPTSSETTPLSFTS